MVAYKLFKVRKDGSIGPLFINRRQRIPLDEWIPAEDHPTKGYAHRPGWHALPWPKASHLSEKGRKWYQVEIRDYEVFNRPKNQGGMWMLAEEIKVIMEVRT